MPESLHTLANLNGTLVFLMGLSQLERIANRLMEAGKAGSTPAAVVSDGNAPHPAVVRGTLKNIAEKVRQADVQAPAVIVVGETAAMNLYEGDTRPLAGVRVGLVGTVSFTRRLEERLLKLGARPVHMMAGRVKSLEPDEGITAFTKVSGWAVFTSQNGVEIFSSAFCKAKQTCAVWRSAVLPQSAGYGTGVAEAWDHGRPCGASCHKSGAGRRTQYSGREGRTDFFVSLCQQHP